ncbi:MAG: acyl--CoA ligase [Deltaproteobacteria bacterium]|nr:acyl--CoA ligase [Deltaproteobacteria bacterium]
MLPSRFSEKTYWEGGFWKTLTTSDAWDRNAEACPDRVALSDSKRRLTWAGAKIWIDRLAVGLIERDYSKSDVLMVQLPNRVELALIRVACERAGCLCLPVNPAFRKKELAYAARFVGAKGIMVPYASGNFNYYDSAVSLVEEIECLEDIFIVGEPVPGGAVSVDRMIQDDLEKKYPADCLERTRCRPMEFSVISMTTGTTGFPKFLERSICSHMDMSGEFAKTWKVTDKDVIALFSPSSGGPNIAGYFVAPLMKSRVVMLERFRSEDALRLIEKERITVIPVVPTMLVKLIDDPHFREFDLSSLRLIISIGAALPLKLARDVEERMGAPVVQRYGSVDSGLSATHSPDDPREVRHLTVGKPVGEAEVKLVDDTGNPVAQGEVGEVVIRVKREFTGYFKDIKTTLQSWTGEGWYHVGDLGKWDGRGNLMIVGRKKEMIIRGGQNIYPSEIEDLLLGHEKIKEVAIIGIPDDIMGERACACVVPGTPDDFIALEDMVAFLKGKEVSAYKIPERIEFLDALPMVGRQKIDKKTLKHQIYKKLKKVRVSDDERGKIEGPAGDHRLSQGA